VPIDFARRRGDRAGGPEREFRYCALAHAIVCPLVHRLPGDSLKGFAARDKYPRATLFIPPGGINHQPGVLSLKAP
jgi:hypothetical protein